MFFCWKFCYKPTPTGMLCICMSQIFVPLLNFFQNNKKERTALEEEEELRILVFVICFYWSSDNVRHASIVQTSCQHER